MTVETTTETSTETITDWVAGIEKDTGRDILDILRPALTRAQYKSFRY